MNSDDFFIIIIIIIFLLSYILDQWPSTGETRPDFGSHGPYNLVAMYFYLLIQYIYNI